MKIIYTLCLLLLLSVYTLNAELSNRAYQVSACGLNYFTKESLVTTRAKVVGNPGKGMPVTFNVTELPSSCYKIEAAFVYWIVSYKYDQYVDGQLTVTNPDGRTVTLPATTTGKDRTKGWEGEEGTAGYRVDIKDQITRNGDYVFSTNTGDWSTDGITLIVIYRQLDADYEGHMIIQDGLITVAGGIPLSRSLTDFNVCEASSDASALIIASDLQQDVDKTIRLVFNGVSIPLSSEFWNSETMPTTVTQNQNIAYFGIDNARNDDAYSWVMMGLYYQTKRCRTCPELLSMNISSDAGNSICKGGQVTLTASGAESYNWTSDPPGFNSDQPSITVSPEVSTTYTVSGMNGDSCEKGAFSFNVIVNPLPVVDLGNDIFACTGVPVPINANISSGTPPFTYQWSPSQYLNSSTDQSVLATVDDTVEFHVTVTDAAGCMDRDTIVVNMRPLPAPVIAPAGPVTICYCDSVTLDAGNPNYSSYTWSNNATTPSITVRDSGSYFVTVTDINGCVNTSNTVRVDLVSPTTTVVLPERNIEAAPGDTVRIPFILRQSTYLDLCKLKNFTSVISFNSSMLAPIGATPIGVDQSGRRSIEFKGTFNKEDSLLLVMDFLATLGDTDRTTLNIESFEWDGCPAEILTIDSTFSLIELCYEGNRTRFFNDGNGLPANIFIMPNPVENFAVISFNLIEEGHTEIYLVSMLGNTVKTFFKGSSDPGFYEMPCELGGLSSGIYLLVMETSNSKVTQMIEVKQ